MRIIIGILAVIIIIQAFIMWKYQRQIKDICRQLSFLMEHDSNTLNFRRGSRCPKIAFLQSKFPKNGSLFINYCDIFEKIV